MAKNESESLILELKKHIASLTFENAHLRQAFMELYYGQFNKALQDLDKADDAQRRRMYLNSNNNSFPID